MSSLLFSLICEITFVMHHIFIYSGVFLSYLFHASNLVLSLALMSPLKQFFTLVDYSMF